MPASIDRSYFILLARSMEKMMVEGGEDHDSAAGTVRATGGMKWIGL